MPSTIHAQNFNRDAAVNEPNFSNVGSELAGVHRIQTNTNQDRRCFTKNSVWRNNFIPQSSSRAGLVVPEKKRGQQRWNYEIDFIFAWYKKITLQHTDIMTVHHGRSSYVYNLALTRFSPDFTKVTAAAFNTVVPRSLTFVSVSRRVLSVPVCQTAAVSFDGLTKYDLIVFFPHLGDQSFTRIDDASKSRQTVNFSAVPFHER